MGKFYEEGEIYRPSNGTEGMYFTEEYCMNCIHCDPDPDGEKQCEILCASMCFSIGDPEYPKQWQYKDDQPICTEWVKWDWGNDGDPDDPDNPKAPPPTPDPRQLNLFPLTPNETDFNHDTRIQTVLRQREKATYLF